MSGRRRLSRRDLLRAAPIAGAGAAGVAAAVVARAPPPSRTTHGQCRFCLLHCPLAGTVSGSRLLRVDGDTAGETRGFICQHGRALPSVVHSPDRLRRPLVRHGERLVETSWEEALGLIGERMAAVRARFGAQAVAFQTGWPLVRHPLMEWIHRLARAWGTPNVASVASLCETSGRMGQALTVGSKYRHDLRRTRTLVLWGSNPTHSTPLLSHVVAQKATEGRLVVVDPVRTELAAAATEHLAVRPGTDGALALGLVNVLVREGLVDRELLAQETVGFEALAALVDAYPPGRVSGLTGVGAEQLVRTARLLGTETPTGIWTGLGVEHHQNGVQTVRAIAALEALCRRTGEPEIRQDLTPVGRADEAGPLPALPRFRTPEPVPPAVEVAALGSDEHPLFEMFNREAQGNLLARAILEDRPYPVRALVLIASNALVTSPGSAVLARAAERLELLVSVDPFLTASGRRAHVVLPATTFPESEGVVPPQHEAWPDWKVVFELARAMGLGNWFPWTTWAEAEAAPRVPVPVAPELAPGFDEPVAQSRTEAGPGRAAPPRRPARGPLAGETEPEGGTQLRGSAGVPLVGTPSGKIELASSLLERAGYPALPEWEPPSRGPTAEFPLLLVTGARTRAYINSQFRQVARIRLLEPEPVVRVHPDAARGAGVTHGKRVAIVSPVGRVELRLAVTTDVRPDVAVMPAGWEEVNANLLVDADRRDPISGFPAFRSGVCRLEPASEGQG
ncbi:MAG TPA: molybdopterin-dependent oxidoreductase [Myxococcaceae bacterium]|nr:molybdopterin-dependent oxidoreductase [Myxococcaceae bacterium]